MDVTFKKVNEYVKSTVGYTADPAAARPFRLYGLLVVIIYAVIFLPLLFTGTMYIYLDIGSDTYALYWPTYAFIRDYVHEWPLSGWSFQQGLGASIISAAPFLFDPFNLLIIPFDKSHIDAGIFLAATAKVFVLALLAYGYLARLGYRGVPLIASSVAYTFCGYFIGWGQHYQFATMFVLFTLVLYCLEGWLQSSHWAGLVLSVGLLAAFWPYTLYMSLVFLAVYYLFRSVQLFRFNGWNFLVRGVSTAGLFAWGIALGSVFFLPQVYAIGQSGRIGAQVLPSLALATRNEYYTMFMRLFSNGLLGVSYFSGHLNYYEAPFLYSSILVIILLPRLFLNDLRKKIYVAVLLVCGFVLAFPGLANPVFGAFSSMSYRWTFVLTPVFAAALAEALTVIQNHAQRWVYGIGITLAGVAAAAALILNHPLYPGILGWSIPISVAILVISALLYAVVLFSWRKSETLYWLLAILVFETALTGYVSVNWRGTVAAADKQASPFLHAATSQALERIRSEDRSFYRVNKNYHEIFLTDALFQGFYGEKQYSSITPDSIRDMEEFFGLREPRSNYLTGFSGRQALRDISAFKYMLSTQKHSYAGYEYLDQAGEIYIFRNTNAAPLGLIYENYITLDHFKALDPAARQYILYEAVMVPSESRASLSGLSEVKAPQLGPASAVPLAKGFLENKVKVLDDSFPAHLELRTRGAESYLIVEFAEPASTSIDVMFSLTSTPRGTGKVFFKTPGGKYNHGDSTAFTVRPGTHDYYVTVPVIGVDAVRLNIADAAGTFFLDNFRVFQRDEQGIAEQIYERSAGIDIDVLSNDHIRAAADVDRESLVYFSIPFDQGWTVYVDGAPAEKIQANAAFTAVRVGPGRHQIDLRYAIPWLKEGAVISTAALALLLLLWAATRPGRITSR